MENGKVEANVVKEKKESKIKSFFRGLYFEKRRIRWCKGEDLKQNLLIVLAYAIIIGLILVVYDWLVIKLLQWIKLS